MSYPVLKAYSHQRGKPSGQELGGQLGLRTGVGRGKHSGQELGGQLGLRTGVGRCKPSGQELGGQGLGGVSPHDRSWGGGGQGLGG